jgi:hypothetical protein
LYCLVKRSKRAPLFDVFFTKTENVESDDLFERPHYGCAQGCRQLLEVSAEQCAHSRIRDLIYLPCLFAMAQKYPLFKRPDKGRTF